MQHPNDRQLQLFVAGQLDAGQEKSVEEHLVLCPGCKTKVSQLEREPRDSLLQRMQAVVASGADSIETIDHVDYADHFVRDEHPGSPPLIPGAVLSGTLQLEKKLGRGGMGEAWKAVDPLADRHVVLKFVPVEMHHRKEAMDSVRSSFQKIHALQHQHICPVYSLVDDPRYGIYIVMKYIDGLTLNEYRRRRTDLNADLTFKDIIPILHAVARGLDYAHERKVIHRDIKPGNIMIARKDGVQVIDFGLAEEIRTSMIHLSEVVMEVSGTRPYMAPEQWLGRMQDARTDQYSLAVTAYELFAGHPPFSNNDPELLKNSVLNDAPAPIQDLPDPVNAALLKGLSKKRDDRFPDCQSFVDALAAGAPLSDSMQKTPDRSTIAWMIGLGAVALCALLFWGLSGLFSGPSSFPGPEGGVAASFEEMKEPGAVEPPLPGESGRTAQPAPEPVGCVSPEQTTPPVAFQARQESWPDEKVLAAAPTAFRERMQEIAGEIKARGGFAVAGQVVEKNGSTLPKGMYTVALKRNMNNAHDTYRFDDGWFITRRETDPKFDKLVVATFLHDEVEVRMKIDEREINFHRIFPERTPEAKRMALKGIALDEKGRPLAGAHVKLIVYRSNGFFESPLSMAAVTDAEGRYAFAKIAMQTYSLNVTSGSAARSFAVASVRPGNDAIKPVLEGSVDKLTRLDGDRIVSTLLSPRKVVIDTLYQPDGSTDFDKGNVLKNRYTLELFGNNDIAMGDQKTGKRILFDPATEKPAWGYYEDDLSLRVHDGKCAFGHFYINDKAGHYGLGEVDFDSVTRADPSKIQSRSSPCELNHVYVVRTFQSGHYAKFVVRSIDVPEP